MLLRFNRNEYIAFHVGVLLPRLDHLGEAVVKLLQLALGDDSELAGDEDLADLVADAGGENHHIIVPREYQRVRSRAARTFHEAWMKKFR